LKKITSIKPHIMDDSLLLSFDIDWIKKLNGIPEFDVFIDRNRKLVLISQQKIKR